MTDDPLAEMRRMIAAARLRFMRSALPLATDDESLEFVRVIAGAIGEISPEDGLTAVLRFLDERRGGVSHEEI